MIEALLLVVELILFGLVLRAAGRKAKPGSASDLGIFSYQEGSASAPKLPAQPNKGHPNA